MTPRALLDACAALLREVLTLDAAADGVVSAHFRKHRGLGARERHTLAETTYAVLRRRLLFQHLAQGGAGLIERRLAILGWAGDASFLKAALSADEQAWLAHAQSVDREALAPKLRHNLPDWVAQPLQAQLGDE
jgi:16S rRNA (cytosine967-C5)-methyltransferase